MTIDPRKLALLRRRAERIALPLATEERGEAHAYLTCVIGQRRIGLPVAHLLGVHRVPPITPVPGSTQVLLGIAQVRGLIFAVIDLAAALGERRQAPAPLLALLETSRGRVGVLLDSSDRLVEIAVHSHCQHVPPAPEHPFVRAVTQEQLHLIDVESLLESPQVHAVRRDPDAAAGPLPPHPGGTP